ncbi:hypothetical protein BH09BAC5_BH09BAC5_02940 [soil metagenome]
MIYLLISLLWLVFALSFGYIISYADRIKNIHRIGLGMILASFSIGIFIMGYAITQLM